METPEDQAPRGAWASGGPKRNWRTAQAVRLDHLAEQEDRLQKMEESMQSFFAQMKDFADDNISVEGLKKKASEAWSQVVPVTKPKPNLISNLALENAQRV